MKYLIIFPAIFLLSLPVRAEFYVEAAVGMKDKLSSQPEINLTNPLGKFVVGYQAEYNWSVELEHISSVQMHEEGSGLNAFWITKRIWFR